MSRARLSPAEAAEAAEWSAMSALILLHPKSKCILLSKKKLVTKLQHANCWLCCLMHEAINFSIIKKKMQILKNKGYTH